MRRPALAVLFAVSLAVAGAAGAAEVPVRVHGGMLLVRASLNDRFEGTFLLDTGATYCVVSRDVAREAKLKGRVGGDLLRLMTANGPIEARLAEAREVQVGSVRARDVEVAVVDEPPIPGLDGILGLSYLGRFTWKLDPRAGTLRLER